MEVKLGYKQTDAGVIPDDWEVKRLGEVCRLINGRGFKPFEWKSTGLPIIRIQNLNGSEEFNYFGGVYDKKLEVGTGQLLFAWSGSRGTSFGPHVWSGPFGLLNYHTWKVQVHESQVLKDFLFHALRQLTVSIEGWAHGASALVHVQKWQMEGFEIPLPPARAEQEAIAEALSDADALIESLEQLLAKKRHVKQGAMQELLTGKKRLPGFSSKWQTKHLGDCGEVIMGQSPPGLSYNRSGAGSPLINGPTEFTDRYPIKIQWTTQPARFCKAGDLLICVRGSSTGRTNYANDTYAVGRGVAAIRAKADNDTLYMSYQVICAVSEILAAATGSTFPSVDGASFRKIVVPLPSPTEQRAIAAILSDMDAEIEALETKLAKARHIKQGMMQELLTGRIRMV